MITITYNGNSYNIPEDEETGWEDLTDFLVALGLSSATTNGWLFSSRVATTTPQTLQATDAILGMNVAGASAVTVPTGVTKQFYGVFDVSGAAATNPITITTTGGQLINDSATYVINSNNGGVLFQFNGTKFVIISEFTDVFKRAKQVQNNATNASFVEVAITPNAAAAAAADGTSAQATFGGGNTIAVAVALDSGESFVLHACQALAEITCVSDLSGIFLTSDAGTGVYVSKPTSSGVLTFKNRMGSSKNIEIKALTNRLTGVTAWA